MRNRTIQLVFQTVYCTLALVGCVGSLGLYDMKFTSDFYTFFTNQCNYLCAGIVLAELIQTAKKKGDSYVSALSCLRFITIPGIVVTFLVFNFMLANAPARDPALNYQIECILFHMVLPVLYVADWMLFYEHKKVRWTWPLYSAILPLAYLLFVFVHAAILRFDSSIMNYAGTDPVIYPYFFLNPERVGFGGIALWSLGLLAAFIVLGYLFMAADRLLFRVQKKSAA